MPPVARRAPDPMKAREALHRALRLLDDQDDPHALAEARAAAQAAVDAVPYPWRAPHCAECRRNVKEATCRKPHLHPLCRVQGRRPHAALRHLISKPSSESADETIRDRFRPGADTPALRRQVADLEEPGGPAAGMSMAALRYLKWLR
ncbi:MULTISPECIES: hypothetical protein [Streptomyces]|uniref:Uncharacterized protein n=1 Tax=Streptomyces koelreuteriae TaxID=2838015 RepID=A0ABX8G498_9ACTN|nr:MULTISPECIES: hypothetical protein [Streptomyces]QWB21091.1 hypothetical protein KJK29_00030 [Streptomyces koelreuteriae]QWB28042.1 hypothetical protein KJK29_38620 [Streptomyces koelreuteriae]UUA03998.1 hypothetical protein NNW98_00025 [Streptomyces koelreuteriae]UUA11156.1 hypothetical protein NNW98_38840 [Streptomyces koelreuteriae]UUA11623.1 hypothetical protein NNW99_00025 [Streptomyces sp. CRCS-T-1]